MPRAAITKQYRDFTGGLNTDASPLNMPENTVTDILDMVIDKSGKISRARYEDESAAARDSDINGSEFDTAEDERYRVTSYVWKAPNGDGNTHIAVIQIGFKLFFFDLDISDTSVDVDDGYLNAISLSSVGLAGADYENRPVQYASGQGRLYISNERIVPSYIEWDGSTTFTLTSLSIQVRDFNGVDDGLGFTGDADYTGDQFLFLASVTGTYSVAETVTQGGNSGTVVSWDATNKILRLTTTDTFSVGQVATGGTSGATGTIKVYTPVMADYVSDSKNNHLYNLLNQGWQSTKVTQYSEEIGREPDNTTVWTLGKDTNDDFDPALLDKQFFGFSRAPRGRMIFNAFVRDRENAILEGGFNTLTVGDTATVDTTTDSVRPEAVAFAFGRAWWGGVNTKFSSNKVWFSQIVLEDPSFAGKCYQEQDPTAEDFNALLDTDGGEIAITDAGDIKKLVPFRNGVLVFSSTGVWSISGPDTGFTPTSFAVSKLTNLGLLSQESVVETGDSVYYWSPEGIISIGLDANTLSLRVVNMTEGRLNNFYLNQTNKVTGLGSDLEHYSKFFAKGILDEQNNRILWNYNRLSNQPGNGDRSKVTHSLVYNIDLNCFYRLSFIDETLEETFSVIHKEGAGLRVLKLHNASTSGSDPVNMTWYNLSGANFMGDTHSSSEYGHIETFYETLGDTSREKDMLWVVNHFERTEDGYELNGSGGVILSNQSSCLMRAKWEWVDNSAANRWSTQNQVYRLKRHFIPTDETTPFDYGFTVITTRNKVRGHGKAVQLRFDTESGKDLVMLGWDVVHQGNGTL